MKLKVVGSSSSGNCYILESNSEILLIELGVSFREIKRAIGFNLSKVSGAIVTHNHLDHAKATKDALSCGVKVFTGKGTAEALKVEHHRLVHVKAGQRFKVGGFEIKAFDINHDCPEPLGFLISHEECGLTLFLTDTFYCDYKFPGLNNVIVECNHNAEIMDGNGTPRFLVDRITQSHMNLDTCKELLLANDLTAVNNIVLIHLSNTNSDAGKIKRDIESCTGKTVHIAEAGLVIDNFNKSPF